MNRTTNKLIVICLLIFSITLQANEEEWDFSLTPYGWFSGFEGVVNTFDSRFPSHVDMSSSDALNDSDASFMLVFEAKKNGQGIYTDYYYSNSFFDDEVAPVLGLNIRSRTKTTMVTIAYARELLKREGLALDVMVGTRWWQINSAISIYNSNNSIATSSIEQWLDPYIGLKGTKTLGRSNFFLSGGASVGGFGMNSDLFYDVNLNVGYQWSPAISTSVGFRQLELDYDKDNFIYDVKQAGWQVDLTWSF